MPQGNFIDTDAEHATVVESLVFAVPDWHGYGPQFPSFEEAVAYARSRIEVFDYGESVGKRATTGTVDVRIKVKYVPARGVSTGLEEPIQRFSVFPECVVPVPPGQGGLTVAQEDVLIAQGLIATIPAGR